MKTVSKSPPRAKRRNPSTPTLKSNGEDKASTPLTTGERPTPKRPDLSRQDIARALASVPDNGPQEDGIDYAARLAGLCLDGLDLGGFNLARVDCRHSTFRGAVLRSCDVGGANFDFCDFTGADLRDIESGAIIGNEVGFHATNFTRANLQGAHLNATNAEEARFIDADLRKAKFEEAQLWGAVFAGSDLSGADFRSAQVDCDAFKDAKCTDGILLDGIEWRDKKESPKQATRAPTKEATSAIPELPTFEPADFDPNADPEYYHLHYEAEWLRYFVRKHCPPESRIARLFELAVPHRPAYDRRHPSRRGLLLAIEEFYRCPEHEQREILNGWRWRGEVDRHTKAHLLEVLRGDAFSPVLDISPNNVQNGKVFAFPDYAKTSGCSPDRLDSATVRIAVGAAKYHVIEDLKWILARVENEWETLTTAPTPDDRDDEERAAKEVTHAA